MAKPSIEGVKTTAEKATEVALSIPSIKSAHFTERNGQISGVAYDESSGVEFDVRTDGKIHWNVNDDEGRNFRGILLRTALTRAIEDQR
jgi:hypothetical protein